MLITVFDKQAFVLWAGILCIFLLTKQKLFKVEWILFIKQRLPYTVLSRLYSWWFMFFVFFILRMLNVSLRSRVCWLIYICLELGFILLFISILLWYCQCWKSCVDVNLNVWVFGTLISKDLHPWIDEEYLPCTLFEWLNLSLSWW